MNKSKPTSKIIYDLKYDRNYKKIYVRLHREEDRHLIEALQKLVSKSDLSQQEFLKDILEKAIKSAA